MLGDFKVGLKTKPKIIIVSIGPIEHIAAIPKLSLLVSLPPLIPAIPTPNAMKKGTVIGPVVTAPLSKLKSIIGPSLSPNKQAKPKINKKKKVYQSLSGF